MQLICHSLTLGYLAFLPVIVLTQDKFVSADYIDAMPQWVKNFQKVSVNSNHWGILSQPNVIAEHIRHFARQF